MRKQTAIARDAVVSNNPNTATPKGRYTRALQLYRRDHGRCSRDYRAEHGTMNRRKKPVAVRRLAARTVDICDEIGIEMR